MPLQLLHTNVLKVQHTDCGAWRRRGASGRHGRSGATSPLAAHRAAPLRCSRSILCSTSSSEACGSRARTCRRTPSPNLSRSLRPRGRICGKLAFLGRHGLPRSQLPLRGASRPPATELCDGGGSLHQGRAGCDGRPVPGAGVRGNRVTAPGQRAQSALPTPTAAHRCGRQLYNMLFTTCGRERERQRRRGRACKATGISHTAPRGGRDTLRRMRPTSACTRCGGILKPVWWAQRVNGRSGTAAACGAPHSRLTREWVAQRRRTGLDRRKGGRSSHVARGPGARGSTC